MFDTRLLSGLLVALGLVGSGVGCDLPVEPGSDLPDGTGGAMLGPEIDTGADISAEEGADITGQFDLTARVTSEFSPQTIPLPMRALVDQSGEIAAGMASVEVELRSPDAPDQPGATADQPAPIAASGSFETTVTGWTIPAGASEMLQEETDADVALEAQIVDADCFRGDATVTMKNVQVSGSTIPELVLEGPFVAHRTGASCPGEPAGDAGLDAETDTDGGV